MYTNYSNEIKSLDTLSPKHLSDKAQELINKYIGMGSGKKFEYFGWIFSTYIGGDDFDWRPQLDSMKKTLEDIISLVSKEKIARATRKAGTSVQDITAVCLQLISFLTILADEYADYMELFAILHASNCNEKRCKIVAADYIRKIYIAEIERDLDQQEERLRKEY
jgi:hypothetical protein